MNKQEVFNTVWNHINEQNLASYGALPDNDQNDYGSEGCLYRNAYGHKCAIGCLIPDDKYHSDMEGKSVTSLVVDFPQALEHIAPSVKDCEFLEQLQYAHDGIVHGGMERWRETMYAMAKRYNLEVPGVSLL